MNIAKLRLFDALDGGDHFWSSQIREHGADEVLEKILRRRYENSTRSAARQLARLGARNETELIKEIDRSGGRFITAEDDEWPHLLNDLIAPPLGLIVKGEKISCNTIGIVGTRNPTSYGARIASDFAAGFSDRDRKSNV